MANQRKHLSAMVDPDGAVILDSQSGRISTLNTTGAIVWQALERGEPVAAIAECLARMSGEPFEAIREDVVAFIDALAEKHLLPL